MENKTASIIRISTGDGLSYTIESEKTASEITETILFGLDNREAAFAFKSTHGNTFVFPDEVFTKSVIEITPL